MASLTSSETFTKGLLGSIGHRLRLRDCESDGFLRFCQIGCVQDRRTRDELKEVLAIPEPLRESQVISEDTINLRPGFLGESTLYFGGGFKF